MATVTNPSAKKERATTTSPVAKVPSTQQVATRALARESLAFATQGRRGQ
jgi:hypothetical protein